MGISAASAVTEDLHGRLHALGAGLPRFSGSGLLEGKMNAGVMMVPGDPALLEVEGYGRRSLGPLYDDLRSKREGIRRWRRSLS